MATQELSQYLREVRSSRITPPPWLSVRFEEGKMDYPRYFDKQGNPMELLVWCKRLEDHEYKRVRETTLPDGKWVSTVWLGLDHSFHTGAKLIFETMVFNNDNHQWEDEQERYSTEEEAIAGHDAMVKKFGG